MWGDTGASPFVPRSPTFPFAFTVHWSLLLYNSNLSQKHSFAITVTLIFKINCPRCHIFSSSSFIIHRKPLEMYLKSSSVNTILSYQPIKSLKAWVDPVVSFHQPGLSHIAPWCAQHSYCLPIGLFSSLLLQHTQISNTGSLFAQLWAFWPSSNAAFPSVLLYYSCKLTSFVSIYLHGNCH